VAGQSGLKCYLTLNHAGSGKTEAALAYASCLLAAGLAESVIFALPTQATANVMLARLEQVAGILFPEAANVVLAHGKRNYNPHFNTLKQQAKHATAQGKESATVHCAEWLAQSRKRVFLGQVGVCTVDQVLLSVLPVKHAFVRSFGLGKSVLIVDEVHAYDSYMYGLLAEVLQRQREAGGSAILLSATLPYHQRQMLAQSWGGDVEQTTDYPLITQISGNGQRAPSPVLPE
jgi:CRISPR-associated endonuclease/helicase Cas3